MGVEANCPACAAPVEFSVGNSLVVVCGHCQSLVGRADGRIEDYGKVAELVEIDSPLKVGLRGRYKGVVFEVTGRTQLEHSAGGTWNEWYLAFRDVSAEPSVRFQTARSRRTRHRAGSEDPEGRGDEGGRDR